MTRSKSRPRSPAIPCPHCNSQMIVRTSEGITSTYRELRFNCTNDDCGHSCVASLSIIRTVRPSQTPNPEIHLPFSKASRPLARPANDDLPIPANDSEPAPAPAAGRGGAAVIASG